MPAPDWATAWPPVADTADLDGYYDRLSAAGFDYGTTFRGLTAAWRTGDDYYAEARLPGTQSEQYVLHPALLDAVLHVTGIGWGDRDPSSASIPFAWHGRPGARPGRPCRPGPGPHHGRRPVRGRGGRRRRLRRW